MISAATNTLFPQSPTDLEKPAAGRTADAGRLQHAAQQFESLMISEMMKSIREAEESGPMAGDEHQSTGAVLQLADEQFAQTLAAHGGLGLARIFTQSFRADLPAPTGSRND
jgi:Rod binding domain-containing protein